jgi:hypothetical protein
VLQPFVRELDPVAGRFGKREATALEMRQSAGYLRIPAVVEGSGYFLDLDVRCCSGEVGGDRE